MKWCNTAQPCENDIFCIIAISHGQVQWQVFKEGRWCFPVRAWEDRWVVMQLLLHHLPPHTPQSILSTCSAEKKCHLPCRYMSPITWCLCFNHVSMLGPLSSLQVHCNNMFSRGVRMFRQATCYFHSGSEWEANPVTLRLSVDRVSQVARFVTVPLGDRTASAIKCRFHFSDLWMLFSEVAFQSGKKSGLLSTSCLALL